MDFFHHQDTARQRTGLLVMLFTLAVLAITGLVSVISIGIYFYFTGEPFTTQSIISYCLLSFVGVLTVVSISSFIRLSELNANGGRGVAESIGGKLISTDTSNAKHRQLLNVVEEMSIASGIPVPPVYVMAEEHGINAFAAGMSIDDAVIGVTQGALDAFSRDELQGVIAHEFSHILNGDMRLNTRLIGALFGITCIAHFGHLILDNSNSTRHVSRSSSDSNKGFAVIILIAIVCLVLGWLGTLFGNMIKAAISRQREFLADASAVQFTRNDQGIAGALKKIGSNVQGSTLNTKASDEMSHMMFGQSKLSGFSGLFATHPPLDERIRRIEPNWDGSYAQHSHAQRTAFDNEQVSGFAVGGGSPASQSASPSEQLSETGQQLISQLPPELVDIAREPYSARFIAFALIFDGSDIQREMIKSYVPLASQSTLLPWLDYDLPLHLRFPLLELALPALKSLSEAQKISLCKVLRELSETDNQYSLAEWCVINLLEKQLLASFGFIKQHKTLKQLEESVFWLLRELAWVSHSQADKAQRAYHCALAHLGFPEVKLEPANSNWHLSRAALELLLQLKPKDRRMFVKACRIAIESDGEITVAEGELYRVIACFLEVPEPPLTISG
ncbi:M48 family metallopeptidase [Vibrio parahaemolyticus]|uniref:M48 family metallopeptidase n=1 Tax=Vibrio parahaemolyticus TaxID=670 RepID=UPI00038E5735|nr:M48 family metallopeptidase [Vibrio parahaemolyticus]EJG0919711.1 M48 family metallopeptidase [Vibrio parahaemolyticus O1:K68]EJG0929397.1 M48 family metallopeptidase [Vibrio parahaemolyticus O1]EJG0943537.1 M48 family metallopeptidase [Vibrio parahaemolyticus O10]EQM49205.1 peptidase M48 family protein [Vibrio parahaemolyticus VPCR-2010]EGQ9060822.1 M48 family metalloprotease [Vibrio parahaemolyticus]